MMLRSIGRNPHRTARIRIGRDRACHVSPNQLFVRPEFGGEVPNYRGRTRQTQRALQILQNFDLTVPSRKAQVLVRLRSIGPSNVFGMGSGNVFARLELNDYSQRGCINPKVTPELLAEVWDPRSVQKRPAVLPMSMSRAAYAHDYSENEYPSDWTGPDQPFGKRLEDGAAARAHCAKVVHRASQFLASVAPACVARTLISADALSSCQPASIAATT
jgi:hypothetical protein